MSSVYRYPPIRRLIPAIEQRRSINMDTVSNKRITRIESDIELKEDGYKSRLTNRNPRNLEQLALDKKPTGFWLEKQGPQHWNKLIFKQEGRHLVAHLQHWSGKVLVKASTEEPRLTKYFKNPSTTQAASVLAKVISRRCIQSGFMCAAAEEHEGSIKGKTFLESVELDLHEPNEIVPRVRSDL